MRLIPLFRVLIDFCGRHSSSLFVILQFIVLLNEWVPNAISSLHHWLLQAPMLENVMFWTRLQTSRF